jgi:hypothetical protein
MKDVGRAMLDRRPNCRRTDPIASHPLTNPIACRKTSQHEGGGGGRIAADESFELQRVGTFEHHPARLRAPASRRTTISRSGRLYRGLAGFQSSSTSAPASPEKEGDYALHTTTKFFRRALQTPRIVAVKHFDQHPLGACDQHYHLVQRSLEQIGPVRLTMRP